VTQSRQDGETRILELRVAPGEASRLAVYADSRAHALVAATVDGVRVDEAGGQAQGTGPPKWGFVFHATPPEGIDVTLRVRGEAPLPLRVVAYRGGLPQVPELTPVPDDLRWSAASSNLTMIAKTYHV
jgi:hypothetical protein